MSRRGPLTVRDGALAVAWAAGSVVGARGLTFVAGIALARLLPPHDFGLVGMALVVASTLSLFQDLGFGKALLRDGGEEEPAASTVFTIVVGVASALSALMLFGAPWIARMLDGEDLARVLRALAPVPLLTAVAMVPVTLLERRFDFRRRALTEWGAAGAFALVAIGSALAGAGAMGLAAAHVASLVASATLAFALAAFRPRVAARREVAVSLFGFGRWVALAAIVAFVFQNADRVVIGKALGSASLGVYLLAFGLANMPVTIITGVLGRVAYAAFSQLEREGRAVRESYLKSLSLLTWALVPMAGLLGWLGPRLLPAVYGPAWIPAAPVLCILAVYAFFRGLGALSGPAFLARRRSGLFLAVNVLQLLPLGVLVIRMPGTIEGVAWIFTIGMALGGTLALAMSFRLVGVRQTDGWRTMAPALGAGLASAGLVLLAHKHGLAHSIPGAAGVAAGALALYALCFLRGHHSARLIARRRAAEPLRRAA